MEIRDGRSVTERTVAGAHRQRSENLWQTVESLDVGVGFIS